MNERYELPNNVKFNIFDDFVAHFSLSHIHQTTFPYVTTIYQNWDNHHMNQFFVLFHMVGVLGLPSDAIMNFWYDLEVQLQKSD